MASKKQAGKALVIVESPAKARTIGKFLGSEYVIEASIGHVRDLPGNAAEIPEELKSEKWARLGIDVGNEFRPLYIVPKEKREQIRKLKALLKDADQLYLATDEDREGESISWHLREVLAPKVPIRRLVFHEITKEAILDALAHPREIDENLVNAQEARRLVDRLYGYSVSPLLWKKIKPKLSAGRVQSVAIRLIVDRERDRIRFKSASYFGITGTFAQAGHKDVADKPPFDAELMSVGGRRIAIGKDFDPDTGDLRQAKSANAQMPDKPSALLHLDAKAADALVQRLTGKPAIVENLEQKPYTERPAPPFTTSTLQQEAGRKLRFTAQRAMRAAQRLYENGFITYMRTDSTTLSAEALSAARKLIATEYGPQHLPDAPRTYQTKVKNAQEAHEAIRPAGATFRHPREVAGELGDDERRVYDLIWKRTVACQMKDASGKRTSLTLAVDDARFQATGKTIEYPGFRLAYVEHDEDADEAIADAERLLPNVATGERLSTEALVAAGHETQPPARLTEASLIKELEARGIGRPSTYASIIETIQARDYVFKKGTALVPTFTAFAVVQLMERFLKHLVDYAFTAKMEDDLDEISTGKQNRLTYLRAFYSGNGKPGLAQTLVDVDPEIAPQEICRVQHWPDDGIEVRVGRYGPFLARADARVSLPDELPPDELTLELAKELLAKGEAGPRSLGKDPATNLDVFVKTGRFGPYFQLGTAEEAGKNKKPKMASLLKDMTPETVTLEQALAVLALPREVGRAVPTGKTEAEPILAANGRYGPYLKWGSETRSLPPDESLLTITLERALQVLAEPKAARGRGGASATTKVLRELGKHPESGAEVRVLDGRYGAYIADGTTNATVPKGEKIEELTMVRAVELLAARAARGPAKKTRTASRGRSGGAAAKKTDATAKPAAKSRKSSKR
jgi:DNA topoisomerase-1